jgi:uncharacterized protein YkwD
MRQLLLLLSIAWAVAEARPGEAAAASAPMADTANTPPAAQASAELPSDDADFRRGAAIARLNAIRQRAGAGVLALSSALGVAASRHAAYLDANGLQSAANVHEETAGLAAYSGADPFVRMRRAGYRLSYASEVIGGIGSTSPDSACVDELMDTVYHAALLLSRVTEVGLAFGSGPYPGMCTIDLGAPLEAHGGQVPPPGELVAYPAPGMTVASGTYAVAAENPRPPLGLFPNAKAGTPVLVGFRNADYLAADAASPRVVIDRFALTTADGVAVPGIVLADAGIVGSDVNFDRQLHGGFAALVPARPLPAGRYRVTLRARIVGGRSLAPSSWCFDVAAP